MSYPTYHNTTNLNGQQLKEAVISASNQDAAILLIYKQTRKRFTPWDIHGMCTRAGKSWPITSCRRSITNLMKRGDLIKTGEVKEGELGRNENYYQLNFSKYPSKPLEQATLFNA